MPPAAQLPGQALQRAHHAIDLRMPGVGHDENAAGGKAGVDVHGGTTIARNAGMVLSLRVARVTGK